MTGAAIDRRTLIAAAGLAGMVPRAAAAVDLPAGVVRRPIWPGTALGSDRLTLAEKDIPRSPTGLATYAIARRLADAGIDAYVLVYRLPADGWAAGPDAPFEDAQRALRLIAANGNDPQRIGVLGGSAGGHVAARLGNEWARETYRAVGAADRAPVPRPRVSGLLYPVVKSAGPVPHGGSRDELVGKSPDLTRAASLGADRGVGRATPPTRIAAALDDAVASPDNSLAITAALRAAKVPTELHLFERGGHGFGLEIEAQRSPWPDLFLAFARRHGLL